MLSLFAACALADVGSSPPAVSVVNMAFVDVEQRTRYFRGVNVVYKDAPYLPTAGSFHSNLSFVAADADLLASLGVNLIRLGVMWPGVVPREGAVDAPYLAKARDLVRLAASRGIYTIVEPHQDELNPRFCGEGAPDWWTFAHTPPLADFPRPIWNDSFPPSPAPPPPPLCFSHSSFSYIWTYDAARAYQALWREGAAAFGAYWAAVAAAFAPEPSVLGGELWNEPFPGDVFDASANWRDNAAADRLNLLPFYTNVTAAIRAAVPDGSAFALAYEPSWPVGDQDIHPSSLLSPTSGFGALPDAEARGHGGRGPGHAGGGGGGGGGGYTRTSIQCFLIAFLLTTRTDSSSSFFRLSTCF